MSTRAQALQTIDVKPMGTIFSAITVNTGTSSSGNQCQTNGHDLRSYHCQNGHKPRYKCQNGHKLLIDQCQTNGQDLLSYQCQQGHKLLIYQCQINGHDLRLYFSTEPKSSIIVIKAEFILTNLYLDINVTN